MTKAAPGGSAGNSGASADKASPKAASPSGPGSGETSGLIAGTSSGAGLELQAAKVTVLSYSGRDERDRLVIESTHQYNNSICYRIEKNVFFAYSGRD